MNSSPPPGVTAATEHRHRSLKQHLVRGVLLVSTVALCCCHTRVDVIELYQGMAERKAGPPPESEWNVVGLWQRVASDPPTYIPKGYSPTAPRGSGAGTWFNDARDGKKLFVPSAGCGGYSGKTLQGEARKVTHWQTRH